MVKRVFKFLIKVIIFILVYLLQIYVINNVDFFGINGDLCLMALVAAIVIMNSMKAYATAFLCGLVSDILFYEHALKYVVIYVVITAVLIELKKTYKPDSKFSIIIFGVCATVISEVIMALFMIISNFTFVNLFTFIFSILKQCIVNICLAYILSIIFNMCKQEE